MKRLDFIKSIGLGGIGLILKNSILAEENKELEFEYEEREFFIDQKESIMDTSDWESRLKKYELEDKNYYHNRPLKIEKETGFSFSHCEKDVCNKIIKNCDSIIIKDDKLIELFKSNNNYFCIHSNSIQLTRNKEKNNKEINKRVDFIIYSLKRKNLKNFNVYVDDLLDNQVRIGCFAY